MNAPFLLTLDPAKDAPHRPPEVTHIEVAPLAWAKDCPAGMKSFARAKPGDEVAGWGVYLHKPQGLPVWASDWLKLEDAVAQACDWRAAYGLMPWSVEVSTLGTPPKQGARVTAKSPMQGVLMFRVPATDVFEAVDQLAGVAPDWHLMRAESVQGGSVQGGSVQGGSVQGGSVQGARGWTNYDDEERPIGIDEGLCLTPGKLRRVGLVSDAGSI